MVDRRLSRAIRSGMLEVFMGSTASGRNSDESWEREDLTQVDPDGPVREPEQNLGRGAQVGRYVVIEQLGRGGMGVVYAAYDPELDRKVAVKLIHARGGKKRRRDAARARLMREAQSLARLSHPNVITVLDVGTFDKRVFVAMEFVDGETVNHWLKARKRSSRDVLDVFLQAGAGLRAAHEAGLVHRDFKPDNVMIRRDGHVVVLDFGLARQAIRDNERLPTSRTKDDGADDCIEDTAEDLGAPPPSSRGSLSASLTRTGGIMGTPAYMAPEQHLGMPTDARSDQFSFCVTLYEALYGERPFRGQSPATLAFQVSHGRIRPAPRDAKVPGWLRRVLLRGLSADPNKRYPDMGALLDALSDDPVARGRRWAVGIAGIATAAGMVYGAHHLASADGDACHGGQRKLIGVWDQQRRSDIEHAFLATDRSFAADSWRRVSDQLDGYANRWLTAHTDACEATVIHREQSAAMLDLRMACLDRGLKQMAALVDVFSEADEKTVLRAVEAVGGLPEIDRCSDLQVLQDDARIPPPRDTKGLDRFEQLFARARALRDAGRHQDAVSATRQALAAAEILDHPPALARVLLLSAEIHQVDAAWEQAEQTLLRAMREADRAHDDELRAGAMTTLAGVVGKRDPQSPEADRWADMAAAAVDRAGNPVTLRAELEHARGAIAYGRKQLEDAEEHYANGLGLLESAYGPEDARLAEVLDAMAWVAFEDGRFELAGKRYARALRLQERRYGSGHPNLTDTLKSLANVDLRLGNDEKALQSYRRCLELSKEKYGHDHPKVSDLLNNIGIAHMQLHQFEKSVEVLERSLEIKEATNGPTDIDLTPRLENLGATYTAMRELDRAREVLQRALAIKRQVLGPEHADVGSALMNLGRAYSYGGDYDEAERLYTRAMEIWRPTLGSDHPYVGLLQGNMADVDHARGHYRACLRRFERALEIFAPTFGEDHGEYAYALGGLGLCQLGLGKVELAVENLERALVKQRAQPVEPGNVERLRFGLAKALWASNPVRAREEAELARRGLRASLPGSPELEAVEAWLDEHPSPS